MSTPMARRRCPEGVEVTSLDGKTVIPGLIEAHTHLQDFFESRERLTSELERMLYGGIVAIREMAADARISGELNRAARLGQIAAPDIYFAAVMMGPTFRGLDPNGAAIARGANANAGWIQTVTPGMDIPLAVARAAGSGATALKLYIEMEPELVAALTREAHRQGLKVWAHPAVFPNRPIDVVRAGVDGISHTCGLAWQDADLEPRRFATVSRTNRPSFDPAFVQPDSAEMQALFAEMVKRGTLFDPTFSMYPGRKSPFGCAPELMTALARAASRAGVTMLAGTDWHAPPDSPHPSLHDEIIALVEHGILTPAEAIAAATRNNALALGILGETGTIEPGKAADLVVLDANPLDDITAIRRIHATIKRGAWYPRAEYDRRRAAAR
jgi:imidazolonepropionase-like amidohydrolase